MPSSSPQELAKLVEERTPAAATRLGLAFEDHYSELTALAQQMVARERPGNSVGPTDLVNSAFARMLGRSEITAQGTTFFKGCFARECRRILVDHARKRGAHRRGGGRDRVELRESAVAIGSSRDLDLVELDDLLVELENLNPRMGRIVEMRFFAGMTIAECAESLAVSPRTVDDDWKFARAWLKKNVG